MDLVAVYGEKLLIPSPVLGELYYGFMKGSRREYNERKLRELIKRLNIEVIEISAEVARRYATIYLSLERKGTRIPINDVWIAACCMEAGGTLLSRDRHFESVEQIETIVVKAGYAERKED